MKNAITVMSTLATILLAAGAVRAVNIETVHVGNPSNAGDTAVMTVDGTTGYGAVNYEYNIGKYEVTAGQYCEFLNAVAKTDTYGLYYLPMDSNPLGCQITRHGVSGAYTYDFSGGAVEAPGSTAADWANRPVSVMSWGGAARFANWLHNGQPTGDQNLSTTEDGSYYLNGATTGADLLTVTRRPDATWVIPTEDEWYKAAYHKNDGVTGNYYKYPTSNDRAPSNDLVTPDDGNNATIRYGGDYTVGSPFWTTEVGEHENSASPYGAFDMGGNVFEWNETFLTAGNTPWRGVRGGGFGWTAYKLDASNRGYSNPSWRNTSSPVGFRVAEVPEPATMSLLAIGGVATLWRRRRK
ncbi:MAG: SUMF1/EgtB/PvdO family nonheme iron enzyme [Phycisphaerae bacterium]|jgi:formylglycine-generating enzyme required for sulfatase activity|nr:SUMF1/EgtB/PvdO family nonheme iron enzyme [Phycisphaerae bacterium]